jgi:hypothetical protein
MIMILGIFPLLFLLSSSGWIINLTLDTMNRAVPESGTNVQLVEVVNDYVQHNRK